MADRPTEIATQRLLLRPFEATDVPAYAAIRAKPEVARYLPGGEATADRALEIAEQVVTELAALWTGSPGYGPWAVVEQQSGALIGHLGLRHLTQLDGQTELLYMLDSSKWGKGYATEGAAAACHYAFDHLDLDQLIALAVPENTASIRVMQRLGMQRKPAPVQAFGLILVQYVLDRS